jgi:hypothetical protein
MAKVLEIDATTNTAIERDETAEEKAQRDTAHKAFLADNKAARNKSRRTASSLRQTRTISR